MLPIITVHQQAVRNEILETLFDKKRIFVAFAALNNPGTFFLTLFCILFVAFEISKLDM